MFSAHKLRFLPGTNISIFKEADTSLLYEAAARKLIDVVKKNPQAVILLPTGTTPEKFYECIVEIYRNDKEVNFSKVRFFNLDEYIIEPLHPLSYRHYMEVYFYGPLLVIDEERAPRFIHCYIPEVLEGQTPEASAAAYEITLKMAIEANPEKQIDLALLGVGGAYPEKNSSGEFVLRGGHIAFNEPSVPYRQETHVVKLSAKTKLDTSYRFSSLAHLIKNRQPPFSDKTTVSTWIPDFAITIGIERIYSAREVLLLATGESKAPVITAIFYEPPSLNFPASFFRTHSNAHWFLDEFSGISLVEPLIDRLTPNHGSLEIKKSTRTRLLKQSRTNRLPKKKRILVLSPHPDDDVICMGATLVKLRERENNIQIMYSVNGSNAVRTTEPRYQELLVELKSEIQAKTQVRAEEAIHALKRLGIHKENVSFFNANYYYRRGLPGVSPLLKSDFDKMESFLGSFQPVHVFFAAENDPHGAHGLSTQLLAESIFRLNTNFSSKCLFHGYRGAYNEWNLSGTKNLLVIPFDESLMQVKILAIKEHISQLDPLFPDFDPRPFYLRAQHRNHSSGKAFNAMTHSDMNISSREESRYAEVFKTFSLQEFLSHYRAKASRPKSKKKKG